MRDLIIVGAGGFGREVYCWARDANEQGRTWRVSGFLDDNPDALSRYRMDIGVLGSLATYQMKPQDLFVCAIGKPADRRRVCEYLRRSECTMATIIHPTAIIAPGSQVDSGAIICPFALISAHAHVGADSAVYYHTSIDHDARVGMFCQISAHCDITGAARLGDEVFLGSHATVLPGVSVGDRAVVGAGAVVRHDVETGTTVVGIPAHRVRRGA